VNLCRGIETGLRGHPKPRGLYILEDQHGETYLLAMRVSGVQEA